MPTLPYLARNPDGADFNRLITEFDRRLAVALNGNSPLVPCVRGLGISGSAALATGWADMFSRAHSLLGYRFSFTGEGATPYHDLAAVQLGAWADYDHAALTAIADAATITAQDDDLGLVTFAENTDTRQLEGSLQAHTREIESGDFTGEFYFVKVWTRPLRRHTYAVAELVCEGRTELTVPREWDRFACYRVHNLSPDPLTVTVEMFDPEAADVTFEVKPYGVAAFRRPWEGAFDRSLTYFWKWRGTAERPVFLEAAGSTTAWRSLPEQSARANPLARPFGLLDWLQWAEAELDPRELPDQSGLFPMFKLPATAEVFGDLIHYAGDFWAIGYPTDLAEPPEIRKGRFGGYATLAADLAPLGITATETDGVWTLSRAVSDAPGDAARGLDVFAPGSNLLHGGGFHSFRSLPYTLESWVPLRWSATPCTVTAATTTLTVKTLTDAPETYDAGQTADVERAEVRFTRIAVAARSRSGSTATLVLAEDHDLTVNQWVRVRDVNGVGYDGIVKVLSLPATNSFTYTSSSSTPESLTSSYGLVETEPVRQELSADPGAPTVTGVTWDGTWRLTPCGWRLMWSQVTDIDRPGMIHPSAHYGLYDDFTDGVLTHRGTVSVLEQGWPLDESATPEIAGSGNPHALVPSDPRRYRTQSYNATLGNHDPGFSGYAGVYGGGDLTPEPRTADTYPELRSLRTVTFRSNPANTPTHQVANIMDSAHVPIFQEAVACSNVTSIYGQRSALRTETAGGSTASSFQWFRVGPWRYNLLAWHVNAWTRSAPLCTVMDVLLGSYDAGIIGEVWFTLARVAGADYGANGVKGVVLRDAVTSGYNSPPWCLAHLLSAEVVAALESVGLTVETVADAAGKAAAEAAAAAADIEFVWTTTRVPTATTDPEPWDPTYPAPEGGPISWPLNRYYGLVKHTYAAGGVLDFAYGAEFPFPLGYDFPGEPAPSVIHEDTQATEIAAEIGDFVNWLDARTVREWAEDLGLPFVFEASGLPSMVLTATGETPALVFGDSVYPVAVEPYSVEDLSTYNPYGWPDFGGTYPLTAPSFTAGSLTPGAFGRWAPATTSGETTWLRSEHGADWTEADFNWTTGKGGPGVGLWMGSGTSSLFLLNLPDNPPGILDADGLAWLTSAAEFPLMSPPPDLGPDSNGKTALLTDGRPDSIRAVDRGLYQSYAVATATHDPTGKLVRDSVLRAWKVFDLSFDPDWLTASVANLALGPHAIPRTLTAGDLSEVSATVTANGLTLLAPPEGETGAWEVGYVARAYLDLT